jgi:hypothetical protein
VSRRRPNTVGTLLDTSFRRGSQFNHCERRFVLCQQLCDWAENEGSDDEKSHPIGHRRIYRSNLAVAQLERFTLGDEAASAPSVISIWVRKASHRLSTYWRGSARCDIIHGLVVLYWNTSSGGPLVSFRMKDIPW